MNEETNDMIPADPEKDLPASLDKHLRSIMAEGDLNKFREQLPKDFLLDASEGLGHLKDAKQLDFVLQQLNKKMHQQLTHKKTNRKRRSIGDLSWTYWAIIIVFLLTIIGFILVRMTLKH
jgi:hypothetical protein